MRFRPCIDIHNGKVKQIVGGTLIDQGDFAKENFVSEYDAAFYAKLYSRREIKGGHVILLNATDSPHYNETKLQAKNALKAFPGGLQIGGGITAENAKELLNAGASHVIVTSYVFQNGEVNWQALERMVKAIGKERLVLDLSCRKKDCNYYIVTDRWQKYTSVALKIKTMENLAKYCDEFLIHAVDVEGKASGIELELVKMLGEYEGNTITYAGGVHSFHDLKQLKELGKNKINVTIGSALDLFGGTMDFEEVLEFIKE